MWIKICGITNPDDAAVVVGAGANAIGLNFYQNSRRFIQPIQARRIAEQVAGDTDLVGVFVNDPPDRVAQVARDVGLSAVQFHGDETKSDIQRFQRLCPGIPVIRAFRIGSEMSSFATQWQEFAGLGTPLAAALVDAWSADEYGGTGQTLHAALLDGHQQLVSQLILAGGLKPDNVAQAVSMVRPWGVDVASGVESAPGMKSAELVQRFVAVCRAASPDGSAVRKTLRQNSNNSPH
ncbi:MAG: phosphoribosylanthranilate isomerase [Planctomycetaceae bacterium]|jgi:phosphoribosylanthranilate isomerase